MSDRQDVQRDERTVAVENAGYKWAYVFVSFALLIDVMYRAAARNEPAWDLLALVILGGALCAIHQLWHKTVGKTAIKEVILIATLGAAVGIAVVVALALI